MGIALGIVCPAVISCFNRGDVTKSIFGVLEIKFL